VSTIQRLDVPSQSSAQALSAPASVIDPAQKEARNVPRGDAVSSWVIARLSRETSSGRFIPEMDGLRFVAIGMVILFHLNAYLAAKTTLPQYASLAQSDWLANIALVGFRGVELFFVISGFILALPFAAHHLKGAAPVNLRNYYLRRLTRLEPPYFVTVLVLFALGLWVQGKTQAALYPHLGASLCYLHNLIYGAQSPVIGVAWSLEIEVQFYVLVPLLTLLFAVRNQRLRRLSMVGLTLTILSAQALLLRYSPRLSLSIVAYLQFFLIGFLLAEVFLTDWKGSPQRSLYWDLVALAGWPLLFIALRSETLTHWLFPCLVFILYCAAFRGLLINRFFSNPWITAIGGMCYSIYLIHYEVISAVGRFTRRFSEGSPYWIYLLIQLVLVGSCIVIICGLYFVTLEKPCMSRDWPRRLLNICQCVFPTKRSAPRTTVAS
jgi:peptidoglycan/LPS O-acetylase OafA/YrhL